MEPRRAGLRPVALLDRDGTINVKAPEGEYVAAPDAVQLLAGAAGAIRMLNEAGVPIAVVSNQRGIALGRMDEADLESVNGRIADLLAAEGARIDVWLHCPHDRGVCECRKPKPKMLLDALERLGGDPAASLMIGDSRSDRDAAAAAGVPFAATPLPAAVEAWLARSAAG